VVKKTFLERYYGSYKEKIRWILDFSGKLEKEKSQPVVKTCREAAYLNQSLVLTTSSTLPRRSAPEQGT